MTGASTDYFPPWIEHLLRTARTELERHLHDDGLCAICGCGFPGERALPAGFALEAV